MNRTRSTSSSPTILGGADAVAPRPTCATRVPMIYQFALVLVACVSLASAQVDTATITGRVVDPTGALIPEATVTVINTGTNFQFIARSNNGGVYRVQSLQPGPYRITFQAGGFKQLVRDGITLRSGDVLAIDVALNIGNVTDSIEVTGAAPLLETQTASSGSVMSGRVIYELPNQRFVLAAMMFIPGVSVGYSTGSAGVGGYNIAGQRTSAIGVFEDGVSVNDPGTGSASIKTVKNSVAEVKVLTTALPAEYGHSGGGVVSIVKKTGTNEFHGAATAYGRPRSWTHRNFFDRDRTSAPTPQNPNGLQYLFLLPDASIGGPVVLPKLYNGHNRTFFIFGWQKLIEKKTSQYFGAVPTTAMENGDFSFGGRGSDIYDPTSTRQLADGSWTRTPFPNRQLPITAMDPVALKILQIHPWQRPNEPGTLDANGPSGNLSYNEASRTFFDDLNARIDHQFSSNIKMYGSWTYNKTNGAGRTTNMAVKDFDVNSKWSPSTNQSYSLGHSWIINPTLFNDARFGYYRRLSDTFVPSYGKDYGKLLGIPNISSALLPSFGTGNQFTAGSIYGLTMSGPSRNVDETLTVRDDLSKIMGTHALKMGYEMLRLRMNSTQTNIPSGDFRFDGMTAGLQKDGNVLARTGNTFAGFLLGWVRQAQFDTELASWLPRATIHSLYLQDEWKAASNLTLNFGIRYSNETPFNMKYGQMSNFDPTAIDALTGTLGAVSHPTGSLNRRDNNNFQPRIGAAWHPMQKVAIRAGFGVYTIDVKFPTRRGQFQEYVAQANYQRPSGDPTAIYRISQIATPVAYKIRSDGTSGYIGTNYGSRSQEWWDSNLRNPYSLNWDLSVQYQLSPTYVLELMYQGSSGVGLIEQWQTNTFPVDFGANDPALRAAAYKAPQNYRPFTNFGDINYRSNFGHSTYHSGTVKFERRFAKSLTFQTFFTLSKALNSQDNDNAGAGVAPIQDRSLEKGRAGYDRPKRYANSLTYELPLGKGRAFLNRGGWLNAVIGGWQTGWMIDWESGPPLTFTFANSPNNYYPTWVGSLRPDVVGKPELKDNWRDFGPARFNQLTINPVLDINNFAYPAAFTTGNSGRNIVGATPKFALDASAVKSIKLNERFTFQVRLDIHSLQKMLFNKYNFDLPTTTVDFLNPNSFGKITSGPVSASWGGNPLMNLHLQVSF
jgi:hypothetical protein